MVEVVGTAPTSVMVITKFVYRHSWQTNIVNIKAIKKCSIKISIKTMKLRNKELEYTDYLYLLAQEQKLYQEFLSNLLDKKYLSQINQN